MEREYTFSLTERQVELMKDLVDVHHDSDVPSEEDLEDLVHLKVELTRGPNYTRD